MTVAEKTVTIAIAGNPNCGKTTLFNRLTGLSHKVANYPGVTIEKKTGIFSKNGVEVQVLDLPGTYGLSPRSDEEKIASEVLQGRRTDVPPVQGVLCVVDSTCLERSLFLVLQVLRTGVRAAVLLNMSDELEKRGAVIAAKQLSEKLNVPVFSISATKGTGLSAVHHLIEEWIKNPIDDTQDHPIYNPDVCEVAAFRSKTKEICREVIKRAIKPHPWSDKIDSIVMHKLWGPVIFGLVVLFVFQAIFSWAQPFMDWIDSGFTSLAGFLRQTLPPGGLNSFLSDGVVSGVGSVMIFLPQILIIFMFIAILENCGYLARAAMVMDRLLRRVGLQGKSFLPLIGSYACAVPGIMAARTIENRRDRLATILIAPFMTCSARLPVYALLIGAFVPDKDIITGVLGLKALTLFGLYVLGFATAMGTSLILKSSVLKTDRTPFILDIPPYRWPPVRTVLLLMWERSKIFLRRASTVILGTAVVLWFLVSFPAPEVGTDGEKSLENSYAGQFGQFIEPVIKPLGFDWKIGVGLLGAQAAREVMVSSLATIYQVEEDGTEDAVSLQQVLKRDMTPLTAFSLLVFFVFAMQCMATLAVARRETGGWKVPVFMFVYMNAYAYAASFIVYQTGRLLGYS